MMCFKTIPMKPIESVEFHKLINKNVLIKTSDNQWLLFPTIGDEVLKVIKDPDDFYTIRKYSINGPKDFDGVYLLKDGDFIFHKHILDYNQDEYEYDDLEKVVSHLNKYLYEIY